MARNTRRKGMGSRRLTRYRAVGSCKSGKIRWRDRLEALMALSDTGRKNRPEGHREQRVYRCSMCNGWHTTSQPFDAARRAGKERPEQ